MRDEGEGSVQDVSLADYARVLRRRLPTLVATVAVIVGAAVGFTMQRTPVYEASTTVFVEPLTVDPLGLLSTGQRLVDPATEQQVITSTAVLDGVLEDFPSISLTRLGDELRVETTAADQVLGIVVRDADPELAASLADAVANSYLQLRADRAATAVSLATTRGEERLATLQTELEEVLGEIAALETELAEVEAATDAARAAAAEAGAESADTSAEEREARGLTTELSEAQSRRNVLQAQVASASSGVADISGVRLTPGDVLSPAAVPSTPAGMATPLIVAIAVLAGAMLAVVMAFIRERFDGRIRDADEAERILGAPILARIPAHSSPGHASPHDTRSRVDAFRRLSLSIWELRRAGPSSGFAIALTCAEEFTERAQVTVDMVTSLASDGSAVLVVDGDASNGAVTMRLGTDVQEAGLREAVRSPQQTKQFLHTVGSGGSGLSLLPYGNRDEREAHHPPEAHLRQLGDQLIRSADITVFHTGSALTSAESLEIQKLAHGTLVAVEVGRTDGAGLAQLRRQLAIVGVRVRGIVLVSRQHRSPWPWASGAAPSPESPDSDYPTSRRNGEERSPRLLKSPTKPARSV